MTEDADKLQKSLFQELAERDRRIAELRKALEPFAKFYEAFAAKPLRGVAPQIYEIHAGTEWAGELRWDHCEEAARVRTEGGNVTPLQNELRDFDLERDNAALRTQLATVRAETFERCAVILAKYRHTPYIDVDLIIAMFRTAAKEASP